MSNVVQITLYFFVTPRHRCVITHEVDLFYGWLKLLPCDWLAERARWSCLARSELLRCVPQSWTKVVETLSEKDLFVKRVSFSMSDFDISTPSPLFNVVTRSKCPRSVLQHWKGVEGVLAIDKKDAFWNYGRTPIDSVFFCSNMSTLLPMIEACSVKMAAYWPPSFFFLLQVHGPRRSRGP